MYEHTGHSDWSGNILWLVAVAGMVTAYLVASAQARGGPRGWSRWRIAAWLAGCLAVAAALLLPEPGDPRSHMARHLLLGMLAPLGLVLAAPVTLFLRTAPPTARRVAARMLRSPAVHLLGHPAIAAVFSVGGLYVALLTPLPAHRMLDVHYLAAGYLFVWSVAGPDPAPRRPGLDPYGRARPRRGRAFRSRQTPLRPGRRGPRTRRSPADVLRRRHNGTVARRRAVHKLVPPQDKPQTVGGFVAAPPGTAG